MIITTPRHPRRTAVRARWPPLTPLPDLAGVAPLDVAERLRGLPGLALLESARPGRRARWSYLAADPLEVLEPAGDGPGSVRRRPTARRRGWRPAQPLAAPFSGGLMGFLGYDLGRRLEHLPAIAAIDQGCPDSALACTTRSSPSTMARGQVWLASRAVDGDTERLAARRDAVLARLHGHPRRRRGPPDEPPAAFASNLDRGRPTWRWCEAVRHEIARGELYQANVARRLEAPFAADPWPVYRRLRTGDPVGYAAYLDLGPDPASGAPRALLSASPEPFLSVSPARDRS